MTANNTLVWKTLEFDATPGSHVQFTVWNRTWGGSLMRMFFVFFGAAPLAVGCQASRPAPPGDRHHPAPLTRPPILPHSLGRCSR